MKYDIIFIGGGQANVFGAYEAITKNPDLKLLIVDKGKMLKDRVCPKEKTDECANCPTCAIIYGVSGAGAYSDSKFNMDYRVGGDVHTVVSKQLVNKTINYVADIYKKFGFYDEPVGLIYNEKMEEVKRRCIENNVQLVDTPTMHLGTDGSRELYTKIVDYLLEKGVEFLIGSAIEELVLEGNQIRGVVVSKGEILNTIYSDNVIMGVGRSGAKKMMELCQNHGIKYSTGAIDLGVRVEVPDVVMKDINKNFYEAKMIYYTEKYRDKMRTFCSNPSGFIAVEKHSDDVILANGHAYKDKKSTNTNLALLCTKTFTHPFSHPFEYATAIAKMSSMLTDGKILMQSYGDLKAGRRSTEERLTRLNIIPTTDDYVAGDISLACPKRILDNIIEFIEVHDKITPGFASSDLLLYFPEIKFRSTRVEIDENMETSIGGFYSVGDSSGYGSGLNIAAVMGILATRNIMKK
jgi:uncharacterized FAD-dependent dehydrogenase